MHCVVEFNGRVGLEFMWSFSSKTRRYVHHSIGHLVTSSAWHFKIMANTFDTGIRGRHLQRVMGKPPERGVICAPVVSLPMCIMGRRKRRIELQDSRMIPIMLRSSF